jgi:ATP-dependent DNA helicase RecQ
MQHDNAFLLTLLKQYFGYTAFRPLQEDIIRDALAGRDVMALLPTGGGKSLCYQLPAMTGSGLTVVVSPLIALMKDQVDALSAAGIPATFLNSTLDPQETRIRYRGLGQGAYRILYAAPERLVLEGAIESLKSWGVNRLAVDEAHCISEWGHDFRPEYRQLSRLRDLMPEVPIMALTATASPRVRDDIKLQLHLRDARCYVASFNRPNLTYRVIPKQNSYALLLMWLRRGRNESSIVYCQARKTAESLAQRLSDDGISARAYHAGMAAEDRSRHQEGFLRDEIRVVCATIAFGMGINKPNVRFVIHYDLPKNIESYYQETGRAGRDGLPSECVLFFNPGDVTKHYRFIDEKVDARERQIAREQLQQVVHYAESHHCRRAELLSYFGESYARAGCGACDNCLEPRDTYDGTIAAQKFLSCVYRIREHSGFSVGLNHVVEVLTGADTERIRRWGHQGLSTYGIGQDNNRSTWQTIGRELIRLGLLHQRTTDQFSVLELTSEGKTALTQRRPVVLTRSIMPAKAITPKPKTGDAPTDDELFERLRALRKHLANERGVPPYIVFSDVSLRHMAQTRPVTEPEFRQVNGVGDKKWAEYGAVFTAEISAHLSSKASMPVAQQHGSTGAE